ncbi:TonB-dependent receptor [Porphyromonadaceae bacterium]
MYKSVILIACMFAGSFLSFAGNEQDTLTQFQQINLEDVVITPSAREIVTLREMPLSVSLVDGRATDGLKITSLKDISSMTPNFFMPDYGSRLTSTMSVRGVGSRFTTSAVSLYVDDIPYIDKSSFDFELFDIESIEILRGPQGTMYGRNSLGGVIHVRTRSPFKYEGTKLSVGYGNYDHLRANLSRYGRWSEKVGYSFSGYYDGHSGFFTNQFNNKRVDNLKSAGGRAKVAWNINNLWRTEVSTGFDWVDQGGYPYGLYNDTTKTVAPVNYNDKSGYRRVMSNNSLLFQYKDSRFVFTSTTGFQHLNDKLTLDQDFTPKSYFIMSQQQNMNTLNQELTIKSNKMDKWQWVFGASGFYQSNNMSAPVTFKQDGISELIQSNFPSFVRVTNETMPIPGRYEMPSYSLGFFHQSTFNDVLIKGLSFTVGLRLEHENISLKHYTHTSMGLHIAPPRPPIVIDTTISATIQGDETVSYTQLLPKFAVKYKIDDRHSVYGTVSKGYKSGGFNFQMFSDLIQEELMKANPMGGGGSPGAISNYSDRITYKPEYNWNYEVGYRGEWIKDRLYADVALFYIDIRDQQITQFAPTGFGRMARNAGRSRSMGAEFTLDARVTSKFWANFAYGYTNAKFTEYTNGKNPGDPAYRDYADHYVPLAPQHTLSFAGNYTIETPDCSFIDRINLWAQYTGNGRIYWNEENNRYQDFYGLANAKVSFSKSIVRLDLWAKNIFNTNYQAFYFESMNRPFVQLGRPTQVGVDVVVSF